MAISAAKEFLKRLERDIKFRHKVGDTRDEEEFYKVLRKEGYNFTKEEMQMVLGNGISDDFLHTVCGGRYHFCIFLDCAHCQCDAYLELCSGA